MMKRYEMETGEQNTRIRFAEQKLWKYIDWLEANIQQLEYRVEVLKDEIGRGTALG